MSDQPALSVADFFKFGNTAAAETTDLRIKLAKAGLDHRDEARPPEVDDCN